MLLTAGLVPTLTTATASAAPVGQGFNLNASDLRFILKQIKISERHAFEATAANPCGTLLGSGPDQVPTTSLPWGLRTVDGTCNNLVAGRNRFGAADQQFPRLVPKPQPLPAAEDGTSYEQSTGTVRDSQPRVISNLIVDQNATNPAAEEAAGEQPVLTPSGSFFIPNVAPDVGLSAPYNSWFTLFGQFFDHGLDLVTKGGAGTVFMPLNNDDPLFSSAPGAPNFMVLSRATHGGNHEALNQTSPFVDQSQTYSSHPSHQVFLREYVRTAGGPPVGTGGLLLGPGVGMADWAAVKAQARTVLGIALSDADVLNGPLLATDQYGRFLRGPNGFPQLVVPGATGGLVEGNPTTPVTTAGATRTAHAFLDDIAHQAVPSPGLSPDGDSVVNGPPTGPPSTTTYDDEMLDRHFIAGDGRVNENIGLTAVHHIFHSEHNRLADEIDVFVSGTDAARTGAILTAAEEADWKATTRYSGWDYGERLFQAARFVTEMEYQHLAFEEFIRKVQPMVAPFGEGGTGYNTNINPAIRAEFAHAVYRFGHSMLTESVDRIRADGTRNNIPLLNAFLNPPSFQAGSPNANAAAGDVIRGMTRQVGNELDEFVTDALRNELLGLPLDLASLNMARARETGTPGLNAARRRFFAASGNSALAPYDSWADFGFSLKHPTSLNNFIAAYGTHPSITGATTLVAKRDAADAIVYGTAGPDGIDGDLADTTVNEGADDIAAARVPADRYAFLNSVAHEPVAADGSALPGGHTTFVSQANGVTTTGVDKIDLWVGGLAEKQFVFGGLLGPTFNYVFEQQMEDLQFGDRFYYLARTAGLNMLTQLEGNSFSELIHRNTNVEGLPADSFSRPGLTFNLNAAGGVDNDPETAVNESTLVTRMGNGTLRYGGPEHAVWNGTAGANRVWSSEGDDTIRGNDGDDWVQGGDGNDNHIGGLGDDILLDTNGDDTLKGGDGNDTLSSGQGFAGDLNQGGRGNDFIVHGDLAEAFAGPGDDYVLGGPEDDTVFGDDGDDWIENGATVTGTGGGAFNLLQGDNGAPFQDDPNDPGHDVLVGYGGETDYDAEGGDDVMLLGSEIQRSEGMLGFDWSTHKNDPVPGDSDMEITGLIPDGPAVVNRDRFDLVESLSGWNENDVLRGDDRLAVDMVGHELTTAGLGRVSGLAGLLPAGATGFTGGNILIGGAGSDTIEGRGGDDVIDGDAYLNVRISVRAGGGAEIRSEDSLGAIQADVLAGTVNPGQLRIVREILTPANGTAADRAVFTGPQANYAVTTSNGVTTVTDNVGTDGQDRLRGIEFLRFNGIGSNPANDVPVGAGAGPTVTAQVPAAGATGVAVGSDVTATFSEPVIGVTGTTFQVRNPAGTLVGAPAPTQNGNTWTLNPNANLAANTVYTVTLTGGPTAIRTASGTPLASTSWTFTTATTANPTVPAAPTGVTATAGNASATVGWTPGADGGSAITSYRVQVRTGTTVVRTVSNIAPTAVSTVITQLTNGTAYNFRVRAVNAVGVGPLSTPSPTVTPTGTTVTRPTAPVIGTAAAGVAGGAVTATGNWTPPTGGGAVANYRVFALRMNADGTVAATVQSPLLASTARTLQMTLAAGNYRFQVVGINAGGTSPRSARSNLVVAR